MATQLTLTSLLQQVPVEAWKRRIVEIAADLGLDVDNWSEGGFMRKLVAIFARLYTTAGEGIPTIASSRFLDYASGDWLTLLAKQVYSVDRIEATYASAARGITLTNTGSGLFIFDPADLVFENATTHKTFRNTTGGTLAPGAGNTLRVDVIAEEAGSGSNSDVGEITGLVTTFLGVTCMNTIALVALDEQSDPELRALCRASVAARSIGGVKRAYEFYAKTAKREDGTPIGVTRVLVPPADGTGTGPIYIATATGAIPAPDVARVQQIFDEKVTPYGFEGTVISAVAKSISAPCTIWIPESLGLSEVQARTKVRDALRAFVTGLPIGGTVIPPATGMVFWRALHGVISSAIPECLKLQMTSETDIPIAGNEAPTFGGSLIDTTVIQVPEA